jgi:hypothetical protein
MGMKYQGKAIQITSTQFDIELYVLKQTRLFLLVVLQLFVRTYFKK